MVLIRPRYWLASHPDVSRPIGGVKQIHRLAEALVSCGRQATLIQESAGFHPGWFSSEVQTIGFKQWSQKTDLSPEQDVVVLPETFLNGFDSYAPGLPKLIFNQNASYTFGARKAKAWPNPAEVLRIYRHPELLHVLCVSQHDQLLFKDGMALGSKLVSRLVNPIESEIFHPGFSKRHQIAFMPRKNVHDAQVIAALLQSQPWWPGWKLVPIHQKSQTEVAEILRESLVFMALGHPEGFGLPIAEALACGCAVVGYSGLGGRELFDLGATHGVALEVPFGDWLGFVDALRALNRSLQANPVELSAALLACSKSVRDGYNSKVFHASLAEAMLLWEEA